MKKFLLATVVAVLIGILPLSWAADSNDEGCGATSSPKFCSCFTEAMIDGCGNTHGFHTKCDVKHIIAGINLLGIPRVCTSFSPVSKDICKEDITYWIENCQDE